MSQELAGKVAIVTGGAGGLGRAIVELFVEEGAKVVIADVDGDNGTALAERLGPGATFIQTDVSDPQQIQTAVDLAVEQFGGLHIMCNNAGVGGSFKRFLDDDLSDFEHLTAVNVLGVMLGTQRAARQMAKNDGGVIINTTSIGGINAGPGLMTYRSTKAAVVHLTKSIAIELARDGIRVNCVAPAHIPTAINSALDQEAVVRAMQPLQRIGSPRDVAEAVLYLASERAAQITGIVLPVDGGSTAGSPPRSIKSLMAT